MKKILILEANRKKDLSLNEEIRDLQSVIRRGQSDEAEFTIEMGLSVRSTDLHDLILPFEPNIIHFCGHGEGQKGLVFQDKNIDTETISSLFQLCQQHLQCVVLNACYSEVQADEINRHIKYVIGMNQAIRDDAAIAFSVGFYRALGYKKSVVDAFEWGKNAIQLALTDGSINRDKVEKIKRTFIPIDLENTPKVKNLPEYLKPVLKVNHNLSSNSGSPERKTNINQAAIDAWKRKLEFLETKLVTASFNEEFAIKEEIRECKENIQRLGG